MAASAKSLQTIYKTDIFNPGECGVNVGDSSTSIADAGLGQGLICAKFGRARPRPAWYLGESAFSTNSPEYMLF
jgi:hypothetical protein